MFLGIVSTAARLFLSRLLVYYHLLFIRHRSIFHEYSMLADRRREKSGRGTVSCTYLYYRLSAAAGNLAEGQLVI